MKCLFLSVMSPTLSADTPNGVGQVLGEWNQAHRKMQQEDPGSWKKLEGIPFIGSLIQAVHEAGVQTWNDATTEPFKFVAPAMALAKNCPESCSDGTLKDKTKCNKKEGCRWMEGTEECVIEVKKVLHDLALSEEDDFLKHFAAEPKVEHSKYFALMKNALAPLKDKFDGKIDETINVLLPYLTKCTTTLLL